MLIRHLFYEGTRDILIELDNRLLLFSYYCIFDNDKNNEVYGGCNFVHYN